MEQLETLKKQYGKLVEIELADEERKLRLVLRKPNVKELDMYYGLTKANQPNRAAQALLVACAVYKDENLNLEDVEIIGAAITPLMQLVNGITATVKKH